MFRPVLFLLFTDCAVALLCPTSVLASLADAVRPHAEAVRQPVNFATAGWEEKHEYWRRAGEAGMTPNSLLETGRGISAASGGLASIFQNMFSFLGSWPAKLAQLEYPPSESCNMKHLRPIKRVSLTEVAGMTNLQSKLYNDGPLIVTNGFKPPTGLREIFSNITNKRVHFDNFHSDVHKLLKAYGLDGFLEDIAKRQHNMSLAELHQVTANGMTIENYATYVEQVIASEKQRTETRNINMVEKAARRNRRLETWMPSFNGLFAWVELALTDPFPHFFAKLEDVFGRPLYSHDFPTLALHSNLWGSLRHTVLTMNVTDFISGESSQCTDAVPNSEVRCAPQLFWGAPHTHAYPLHRNVHENDIMKFQLKGHSRVALFHPREADRLYPLRMSQWKFQVYMSDAFSMWPCDEYPYFSGAHGFVDTLDDGDILIFSGRWIHDFHNLEEAISVVVANLTNGFVPYRRDHFTADAEHVVSSSLIERPLAFIIMYLIFVVSVACLICCGVRRLVSMALPVKSALPPKSWKLKASVT